MAGSKALIELLIKDTGIRINGSRPYDIQVHNERFYDVVLKRGSLGLGETYMRGWWECEKLDEFFTRLLQARVEDKIKTDMLLSAKLFLRAITTMGRKLHAFEVGERHYDVGNELYMKMLDPLLCYTCGYWKDARTLEEAQRAKLDLICRKIGLKRGQQVLDIGSGWGSFLGYAAQHYGVRANGITVSKEQKAFTDRRYAQLPVEVQLQDYRDVEGTYNHVVSVGMFEHVGYRYYRTFMKTVHRVLQDDGLFLLHTIGGNTSVYGTDPWIDKYIFPNGMLPSVAQIGAATEGLFVMEDWHNFGADYDKTLMAWHAQFEARWDSLKDTYDEVFHRMWRYYLLMCAGSFRARKNQLWQIVFSKRGVSGGYCSVR